MNRQYFVVDVIAAGTHTLKRFEKQRDTKRFRSPAWVLCRLLSFQLMICGFLRPDAYSKRAFARQNYHLHVFMHSNSSIGKLGDKIRPLATHHSLKEGERENE